MSSSYLPPFKDAEEASLRKILSLQEAVSSVLVGQKELIEQLIITLLCRGHLLIEGLPGLAKTLAVKTLSHSIKADFKRIQFTPDLLPADLIGTTIYRAQTGAFEIKKGPLFTEILLADEINRAPPKVQSALLEAMGENQVTIGNEKFNLGNLFMVLATQNPIEQEGTYPLPEAQTDRFFMKTVITYPTKEEEKKILKAFSGEEPPPEAPITLDVEELLKARKVVDKIYADEKIRDYILDIVEVSRSSSNAKSPILGLLEYGASPRASLALLSASRAKAFLLKRNYVIPQDVKQCAHAVLRHRIRPSYEAEAEELSSDKIIDKILQSLSTP